MEIPFVRFSYYLYVINQSISGIIQKETVGSHVGDLRTKFCQTPCFGK